MLELKFKHSPCALSREEFIEGFGGVYEHSTWVAERVWDKGLDQNHNIVDVLAIQMAQAVDLSDKVVRLELIVSHPDLAGKAAQMGELTTESTSEQAGAGIDQCNQEEFEKFQRYNSGYKEKFNFPFVMAVKGSNRHLILAAFSQRIHNDYETEFNQAINEIHKIARYRLEDIANK